MKLNGTQQPLVYADADNTLVRSAHTVKKYTQSLAVASKEIGLQVNADKTNMWPCLDIRIQNEVTI